MSERADLDFESVLESLAFLVAEKVRQGLSGFSSNTITPRLLSVDDAAKYLGRTKDGLQHMIAAGTIPTVRADRRVFLDVRDLDDWIDSNKRAPVV